MKASLYTKIILMFVILMVTVMAVVGTVLLNSVFWFYSDEFSDQMEATLGEGTQLREDLTEALSAYNPQFSQKEIINAYSNSLGIDDYRNYYILSSAGVVLESSVEDAEDGVTVTENLLSALGGVDGKGQIAGNSYSDYAIYLENEEGVSRIVYIIDSQEEMRELSWQLFSIILQALFFGLVISIVLSFFLAKAISSPIRNLTHGTQLVASGNYQYELEVRSNDEIGTLTSNFNEMKDVLKKTIDEVSGERQKLETVFSYLQDAVIAFSSKGKIININKSAVKLFGDNYSDDFTLQKMLSLVGIEFADTVLKGIHKSKSYVMRDVSYGEKFLDISFGGMRYIDNADNKQRVGYIAVIHDITERYELDKQRREFVANVSHELRTPLTSIKGATESVLLNPDMPNDMRDTFLNMAIEESDRMRRIIDDLLTLSRFDNNKTQWKITNFDIEYAVRHVCDVIKDQADAKGHTVEVIASDNVPWITADKEKIEQVIINIITNSIKYTKENGKIIIGIKGVEKGVEIKVSDNGIGIPEEDISRLFERFYRVEKARTSDTGGTGLGLAISKEIVDAHGGNISVDSRFGKGTEVTIFLPFETLLAEN